MRLIVTLLVSIISALVGVVAILGGQLWNHQPTCSGCGANIGAGMLIMVGWFWLVISLIAVTAIIIWAVARRVRNGSQASILRNR